MILIDKGYYDYDYERTEKKAVVTDWDSTVKSDEEVASLLSMFGIGQKKRPETEEELQDYILNQMEEL